MFSPQEQQIKICLLKSNLEEIENDLVEQESLLPTLEAGNTRKYQATSAMLDDVRRFSAEVERLKQENIRLTAKRVQLKRQCEDINRAIEAARENRNLLTNLLDQEEQEVKLKIRQYEDYLQEEGNRFRRAHEYYNEEKVKSETDKVNCTINELEKELIQQRGIVDNMKRQLDAVRPDVPENILAIVGNSQLDDKIKILNEKHDALVEKRNFLLNQKNSTFELALKKF